MTPSASPGAYTIAKEEWAPENRPFSVDPADKSLNIHRYQTNPVPVTTPPGCVQCVVLFLAT
jgi:hypothetical protein